MIWSRSTSTGGHPATSPLGDDKYYEVDIPSLVDMSMESSVESLRDISTCLSANLLLAYRAIHLLTR